MSTLTVTIAESQAEFVARQAAADGFESVEAYVRSLIASAEREAARERLEAMLLDGLEGRWEVVTDESWEELKREVRERRAALRGPGSRDGGAWREKMRRYDERHPAELLDEFRWLRGLFELGQASRRPTTGRSDTARPS